MTDNLFTLAQRAAKALTAYEKGVAKRKVGQTETIAAVIEYGKALLEGRAAHGSNDEFGKWIQSNELDQTKPFERRQERTQAMQIAKIVIDGSSPVNAFLECSNSRPVDIMKWARMQPWFEKTLRVPKAAKPPSRTVRGRPRKDEPKSAPVFVRATPTPRTPEEVRRWVDPEFTGTPMEFTAKYGHVPVMTAEQYATERFGAWARHVRALMTSSKQSPELPEVDHNWLRSPKDVDVRRLAEALDYLRPIIAEAETLLERAKGVQDLRQRVSESLQTL